MTAHVQFPNIDKKPATFSKEFLKIQLRDQRGFKGILVSDDIDMKALEAYSSKECFFQALKGGCDLIIACQKEENSRQLIEYFRKNPLKKEELKEKIKKSSKKILEIKKQASRFFPDFTVIEKELLKSQNKEFISKLNLTKGPS